MGLCQCDFLHPQEFFLNSPRVVFFFKKKYGNAKKRGRNGLTRNVYEISEREQEALNNLLLILLLLV